jgi:hypothetical protein
MPFLVRLGSFFSSSSDKMYKTVSTTRASLSFLTMWHVGARIRFAHSKETGFGFRFWFNLLNRAIKYLWKDEQTFLLALTFCISQ